MAIAMIASSPTTTVRDNDIVGISITVTGVLRPAFFLLLLKSVATSLTFFHHNEYLDTFCVVF